MDRITFEPAIGAPHWPWSDLGVYVVGSTRPPGTPGRVVVDPDPARLLERLGRDNRGGDVHLVGGPSTVETFRALGALDEMRFLVLPMLGGGRRLTPEVSAGTGLSLVESVSWPNDVVELVYAVT